MQGDYPPASGKGILERLQKDAKGHLTVVKAGEGEYIMHVDF